MQLSNVRRIIAEDFPKEDRETVNKLAEILNSFMDEVVDLSRGNIDYENLNRSLVSFDVMVDSNFKPIGNNLLNTKLSNVTGANIVNVIPLTNGGDRLISAPYVEYINNGNGFVTVSRVFGLPANKKMRVYIEFIR